jgi:hypothetical protein
MSIGAISPAAVPAFERGFWNRTWFMLLLCAAFMEIDWELVPLGVFPFVFIFPVMLTAWNRRFWLVLAFCLLMSLTRVVRSYYFDLNLSVDDVAGALIRFFVLVLLATLTTLLGRQTRQLRRRVQLLEGILPICSRCKSIRDTDNNWVQLEGYITAHSTAQFSHGLCPHCFKEFYGEEPARADTAK